MTQHQAATGFVTVFQKGDLSPFGNPGSWSHDVNGCTLATDTGCGSLIVEVLSNAFERTLWKQLSLDLEKNHFSVSIASVVIQENSAACHGSAFCCLSYSKHLGDF